MPHNKFDFRIAAKRLKKLVAKSKVMFDAHGVKTVHVCFTGDMINSDRRLDEMMNAATNRAKASVLAALILKQTLLDLNQDYNLKIHMITGNESRMHQEMGASEIRQSDNYDMIIHEMLRMMFIDKDGIEFVDGDVIEHPIRIKGQVILMIHGHQIKMSGVASQIQRLKGKWSDYLCHETINYVLFGHFHTSRITDLFARSGGLCGANAYSALGTALRYACRPNEAIPMVEKAISLNPIANSLLLRDLGVSYQMVGKYEDAIVFLKKSLQERPNGLFSHLHLAVCYVSLGREEQARAEATEVLRIHPKFSLEYYAKILPYKDQSVVDHMIACLRKAGLK